MYLFWGGDVKEDRRSESVPKYDQQLATTVDTEDTEENT